MVVAELGERAVVASLTAIAALAGWSRTRIAAPFAAAVVVAWLVAAVLFATDYRDADGAVDCWPDCTALQDAVEFVLFVAPVMLVALLLGGFMAWLTGRRNR